MYDGMEASSKACALPVEAESDSDASTVGFGGGATSVATMIVSKCEKVESGKWTVVRSGLTRIQCDTDPLFAYEHSRLYPLKRCGDGAKVSGCCVHNNCPHQVMMRCMADRSGLYEICERGTHSAENGFAVKASGLSGAVLPLLDPLLSANVRPSVAVGLLKDRLKAEEGGAELLAGLPNDAELTTRIAHRKRTVNGGLKSEMQTPHLLNLHLLKRELDLNSTAEEVRGKLQSLTVSHGPDGLLCLARLPLPVNSPFLKVYNYDGSESATSTSAVSSSGGEAAVGDAAFAASLADDVESGAEDQSLPPLQQQQQQPLPSSTFDLQGYVFSSGTLLSNIDKAMRDLPNGVYLDLDGTYKLVSNGWTLVVVGTHTVHRPTASSGESSTSRHGFVPFLMSLMSSESEVGYRSTLGVLREAALKLFGKRLVVRSACMDRSDAIKNACVGVFSCRVATCWPHLMRNSLKMAKSKKVSCLAYYQTTMLPHLQQMHLAPTARIFGYLRDAALAEWKRAGYTAFAEWLETYYLSNGWDGWRYGAAEIPGAAANNNVLESFNKECKDHLAVRSTPMYFVETGMPAFLRHCGSRRSPAEICGDPGHNQHHLITTLPLCKEMVAKAVQLVKQNVLKQVRPDKTTLYYVASTSHTSAPISVAQVVSYEQDPPDELSFADAVTRYLCVHRVRRISGNRVKDQYVCDCKQYVQSAFVCAHVLAVYDVLVKEFSLSACIKSFTGPREGGRPSKKTTALEVDTPKALREPQLMGAVIEGTGKFADKRTGVVGQYNKKTKSFMVRFLHQPDGECDFTVPEEEVLEGYRKHKEVVKKAKEAMASNSMG